MSAKTLDLPAPSEIPATIRANIRGIDYTISELPMDKYNELLERATNKVKNDVTGETEDEIDNTLLMRLMVNASVSPKPESLMKLGVRHYRALTRLVQDLHYGDEPVKIVTDEEPSDGEAPKADA